MSQVNCSCQIVCIECTVAGRCLHGHSWLKANRIPIGRKDRDISITRSRPDRMGNTSDSRMPGRTHHSFCCIILCHALCSRFASFVSEFPRVTPDFVFFGSSVSENAAYSESVFLFSFKGYPVVISKSLWTDASTVEFVKDPTSKPFNNVLEFDSIVAQQSQVISNPNTRISKLRFLTELLSRTTEELSFSRVHLKIISCHTLRLANSSMLTDVQLDLLRCMTGGSFRRGLSLIKMSLFDFAFYNSLDRNNPCLWSQFIDEMLCSKRNKRSILHRFAFSQSQHIAVVICWVFRL